MRHIASCSFGKDSLAMILRLIDEGYPLDEVVFYNTGMEFDSIYKVRDSMKPVFDSHGIKFTELTTKRDFWVDMLIRPVEKRDKSSVHWFRLVRQYVPVGDKVQDQRY